MFKNFKIGTKITIVISLVTILCLGSLSTLISIISSKTELQSSEDLLQIVSQDAAKSSLIIFNEVYTALANSHGRIQMLIQNSSNDKLRSLIESVINVLDNNNWGAYSYIYIKDIKLIGNQIDSKYQLNNGEFMLIAKDNDMQNPGGVVMMPSDEIVANFASVQQALRTGRVSMGNPSMQSVAGERPHLGIAINFPLKDLQGITQGVVGIFIDLESLSQKLNNNEYSYFHNDYRIMLSENLTIASHPSQDFITKNLLDVINKKNDDTLINAIKSRQSGIFPFIDYKGEKTLVVITSFEIGYKTGIFWSTLALAPIDSIYADVYELNYIIIGCSILILLILTTILYFYIHNNITTRITNLSNHLLKFFRALQHKGEYPTNLKPRYNDEFGQMAVAINENIQKTQKGLEQDT
ncbi:MAG: hypothetical protein K2I71_00520, partial [Helicobacter sp.]|nr:hypothetical protein [Helicobacter sp.]